MANASYILHRKFTRGYPRFTEGYPRFTEGYPRFTIEEMEESDKEGLGQLKARYNIGY